jgi:hypothetical protein
MSLDLPREWKEGKDSAEVQQPERVQLPDRLIGASGTPFFLRRSPAEFGLAEERTSFDLTHFDRLEYVRERPAGMPEIIQRRLIPDALGSPRARDWDVEAGLARLRHRLERLRSDPAEQRRMDELLAEIPPPESFVRTPPAKEPLIDLSPRSSKSALDTPLVHLRSKDEHGKIKGMNQIRGKDQFGGRGKTSI